MEPWISASYGTSPPELEDKFKELSIVHNMLTPIAQDILGKIRRNNAEARQNGAGDRVPG